MSEPVSLNAYFERIGFAGSIAPTLATLETLLALHPAAIPFENLDPFLGRPVALDQKSLERKLLAERRGGFGFEHNILLARMLRDLDFPVRAFGARVLWNQPEGRLRPVGHMLLGVDVGGAFHIADAGFGAQTPTVPLRLRDALVQETPHGTYRVLEENGGWRLEMEVGEDWRALYAFDLTDFADEDFAPISHALATDPASRFRTGLHVALAPKETRLALENDVLTTRRAGEPEEKRTLSGPAELRETLAQLFGLVLSEKDAPDAALARLFPPGPTP